MITLSVDDQQDITLLMKKMLTRIDPKGTHMTAANMDEALKMLSDRVQVIFLDIEMKGLKGIEAADLLSKKSPLTVMSKKSPLTPLTSRPKTDIITLSESIFFFFFINFT